MVYHPSMVPWVSVIDEAAHERGLRPKNDNLNNDTSQQSSMKPRTNAD